MKNKKTTSQEIKRLSDLNRVAGYLEAIIDSRVEYIVEIAEKAKSILEPHLKSSADNTSKDINIREVNIAGMILIEWSYMSCIAHFATGDDWATLYDIKSKEQGKGHATELMKQAKIYYEKQGKKVGGTVALNNAMRKLYKKLNYHEYSKICP